MATTKHPATGTQQPGQVEAPHPARFRAWDKEDQRFIIHEQDFIPLRVTNWGVLKASPFFKEDLWEFVPADRFVITEWSTLVDEDGTPIYEGDKVLHKRGDHNHVGVVCLREGEWRVDFNNGASNTLRSLHAVLKVVGHIYKG